MLALQRLKPKPAGKNDPFYLAQMSTKHEGTERQLVGKTRLLGQQFSLVIGPMRNGNGFQEKAQAGTKSYLESLEVQEAI